MDTVIVALTHKQIQFLTHALTVSQDRIDEIAEGCAQDVFQAKIELENLRAKVHGAHRVIHLRMETRNLEHRLLGKS